MSAKVSERKRQVKILTARYVDVLLGDLKTVALLALQAPLIGGLAAGVWMNVNDDTLALYFVLALSAFFLGAVNSAREIVKERDVFLRERMVNLSAVAYVQSKFRVQGFLMVLQCALLIAMVALFVPLHVSAIVVFFMLIPGALAGTAVGLLISALVKTPDKAVLMVPLVVIPQILLSDLVLSGQSLENWTRLVRQVMPVHWSYRMLEVLRQEDPWWELVGPAVVLAIAIAVCYGLTMAVLSRARYR